MSSFTPTTRIIAHTDEPDRLAGAVLNSLTRPLYRRDSWGPLRAFVMTGLTIGVLPLLKMMSSLRAVIPQHEQQFWHLSEWMRLQTADADATELQRVCEKVRFSTGMATLAGFFLAIAIGALVMHFTFVPFSVRAMYRFAFHVPHSPEQLLFTFAISAAAVTQWSHLAWHQQNVERFVRWFNHLASRHGLAEVPLPKLELGLRPIWIIAGFGLAACGGALWAIPVMLAAGAHRRYIIGTSVVTRAMLAERVRTLLVQRRPIMRIPQPLVVTRQCVRPNCRAPLPSAAIYCPRCGTRASSAMNIVA